MSPISRRNFIKIAGAAGLTIYLSPSITRFATAESTAINAAISGFSPIDRSLSDVAAKEYFGDNFDKAHQILWDKQKYFNQLGVSSFTPTGKVKLAVIGGGLSGLFTSYLLRAHNPVLFEQAPRFGGNSKGQSWRGIDYSIGAAYFCEPEEGSDIYKVLHELGLHESWKLKEEEDPVALNGTILKEFWSGQASEAAKAQNEKLSAYFQKVYDSEEGTPFPDIPVTVPSQQEYINKLDKVSFKQHLEEIAGGPLVSEIETAIEQYCWSSFGASSTEIGAAQGLNFYTAEFGNLCVFPGGNSAVAEKLVDTLSKALPKHCLRPSSLVVDVKVTDTGVRIVYVHPTEGLRCIEAGTVVMACPKFVVKKVLNDIEPARQEAINKLRYRAYMVCNVLLKGVHPDPFYDLYMLGDGKVDTTNIPAASQRRGVTDVILANYAKADAENTVLTLYRALPYDGGRTEVYMPDSYTRFRGEFESQVYSEILPLLGMAKENVVDIRVTRWGHPLPVAATGSISSGQLEAIRKPFGNGKVFFVEQDNWALPAFETALSEALIWAPEIEKKLKV